MKWNLKKMQTECNSQIKHLKKVKRNISPKKIYINKKFVNPVENNENTTNKSSTKASFTKPNVQNERYSKIIQNDDKIGEDEMMMFQKQLTMSSNVFHPKTGISEFQEEEADFDFNDLKIDEEEEDFKSEDDHSESESKSKSKSKKKENLKSKKIVVTKKKYSNKEKKAKFFVHKAQSFKKATMKMSLSPMKGVIGQIASSKRKINFMKLNSIAFKESSNKKVGEIESVVKRFQNPPTKDNFF